MNIVLHTYIEETVNMCKIIQDNIKDLNVKVGIDMEITASYGKVLIIVLMKDIYFEEE